MAILSLFTPNYKQSKMIRYGSMFPSPTIWGVWRSFFGLSFASPLPFLLMLTTHITLTTIPILPIPIQSHLKQETASLAKKLELLEVSKRKLLGEGLGSCTIEELHQIEQQLEKSVCTVRAKKMQVFKEQIEQLKEKEKTLEADKAVLCAQYELIQPRQGSNEPQETLPSTETSENSDVETELFIGLRKKASSRALTK